VPRFSVIILNWNGRDLLAGCLKSLAGQEWRDFETVVVDNGSNDGSLEMLEREFGWVRLISNPTNAGYCRGNNQGIEASTGELVVLLNNDAEVAPEFLGRLAAAADENPECGMFATRIMMFDRRGVYDSTGLLVYPDGI
jgi:GT2 family glycosyltransferase